MNLKPSLCALMMLFAGSVFAGSLKGVVKAKDTSITLPNAVVAVQNTSIRTIANVNGEFAIENLADGNYKVRVTFAGFAPEVVTVDVSGDTTIEVMLSPSAIDEEILVTANRAVVRETPVAFSNVTKEDIQKNYTTQDVPELMKSVPGVFTRSQSLGESDLYVRGFDSERVQIMINNVPVNDPESQVVYWSNWTGLSGNANSIQVQRGVGSSLYGSGAFGGSVNIQTDNFSVLRSYSLVTNYGSYASSGDQSNYNIGFDYSSGFFNDDKMNFYFRYERKEGDGYIQGTNYDGHSYYFGFLYQPNVNHSLTFNFHGAPQEHNQTGNVNDPNLLEQFGRTWNRRNHPYQENYYHKPVFEIHHEWFINTNSFMRSTFFMTQGRGGVKYLRNDWVDLDTGAVGSITYVPSGSGVKGDNQFRYADRNYTTGSGIFNNAWQNDSVNNHNQLGFNTHYKNVFSENLTMVIGAEWRTWDAEHYADSKYFEFGTDRDMGPEVIDEVERRYDYDGEATNSSVFARLQYSPMPEVVTIMADVQQNWVDQSISENGVRQYDFYNRAWTDIYARATRDIIEGWDASNGVPTTATVNVVANPAALDELYERSYDFFQPKFGINWNITQNWNMFLNYSQAKKEPKVGDWYTRTSVPKSDQDLKEESLTNSEIGIGYRSTRLAANLNYYMMEFEDKIESITDINGDRETINAGNADHDGIEFSLNYMINQQFSFRSSFTFADNKWTDTNPNITNIFSTPVEDVVGKYVPGSPQTMMFLELDYNGDNWFGWLSYNAWDDYYVTYDNTNLNYKGVVQPLLDESGRLPDFMEMNLGFGYKMEMDNGTQFRISLRANNFTGEDNYLDAYIGSDYGRADGSGPYLGVIQAPLENYFLSASFKF